MTETTVPPEPETNAGAPLPPGFAYRNGRIVYEDQNDPEKPLLVVCGPLRAMARTHDGAGHDWGLLLGWLDPEGHHHQ